MDSEEFLEKLLNNFVDNDNMLPASWIKNPDDSTEGWVLVCGDSVFIVRVIEAKIEVVE